MFLPVTILNGTFINEALPWRLVKHSGGLLVSWSAMIIIYVSFAMLFFMFIHKVNVLQRKLSARVAESQWSCAGRDDAGPSGHLSSGSRGVDGEEWTEESGPSGLGQEVGQWASVRPLMMRTGLWGASVHRADIQTRILEEQWMADTAATVFHTGMSTIPGIGKTEVKAALHLRLVPVTLTTSSSPDSLEIPWETHIISQMFGNGTNDL